MVSGEPFRVVLEMRVKPGLEPDFERVWLTEVGESAAQHPANLGQWLARGEQDGLYYVISDWVDERSFREFETSERHLAHRRKLAPFRAGGSMTTMQIVVHLPGNAAGDRTHQEWEMTTL